MFYHHHHLASVAAHHHSLHQNRIHNTVTTPSPPVLQSQQSSRSFPAPTTSIPSSTSCTFLTNTTGTVVTSCQQRTIAKPIARRPANAANHSTNGVNGNLHNSTLLALAAAAANSALNRPVPGVAGCGGGIITHGSNAEGSANGSGESGGGTGDSPAPQGNAAISASSTSGN